MKKFFTVIILILVIAASFGFAVFKFQSLGPKDNYFNTNLRSKFAQNFYLRKILSLHYDGDAATDYLGSRYEKILLEIDKSEDFIVPYTTYETLAQKIAAITGKQVTLMLSDQTLQNTEAVDPQDLARIVTENQDFKTNSNRAVLYLLILGSDQKDPSLIGTTVSDDAVIVYGGAIYDFTATNPSLFESFVASTALHEFGHQFGLGHNNEPNCLMNEEVEEFQLWIQDPSDVVSSFCQFELNQIQTKKDGLN